jgi:hypothetical protein
MTFRTPLNVLLVLLASAIKVSECATCGGSSSGMECKFPFFYNGVNHSTCTSTGHDRPWCATDWWRGSNDARNWAHCDCPDNSFDWLLKKRVDWYPDWNDSSPAGTLESGATVNVSDTKKHGKRRYGYITIPSGTPDAATPNPGETRRLRGTTPDVPVHRGWILLTENNDL